MSSAEQDYILLSKLFGSCLDMVQGKGGNISVKDGSVLFVKQSGFIMGDTAQGKGYLQCDLQQIQKKFQEKEENLASTVLVGNGHPSMETFFHALPPKYIVHLHPTSFMNLLCQSELQQLQFLYPQSLCLPYVQPGYDLSELLHKLYEGQSIVFLQNHGVIFLENSLHSLMTLVQRTFATLHSVYPTKQISDVWFLYEQYSIDASVFWKPSFLLPCPCRIPRIKSFTPDLHLFLVNGFEDNVVLHRGTFYLRGKSKEAVDILEQMYASYLMSHFDSLCQQIPLEKTEQLEKNPLEQARLALSK